AEALEQVRDVAVDHRLPVGRVAQVGERDGERIDHRVFDADVDAVDADLDVGDRDIDELVVVRPDGAGEGKGADYAGDAELAVRLLPELVEAQPVAVFAVVILANQRDVERRA